MIRNKKEGNNPKVHNAPSHLQNFTAYYTLFLFLYLQSPATWPPTHKRWLARPRTYNHWISSDVVSDDGLIQENGRQRCFLYYFVPSMVSGIIKAWRRRLEEDLPSSFTLVRYEERFHIMTVSWNLGEEAGS